MAAFKTTGAELIAFYKAWPVGPDWYHDDGFFEEEEDGTITGVDPEETFEEPRAREALGYLCWQGPGNCPSSIEVNGTRIRVPEDWSGPDIFEVFKVWVGCQQTLRVVLKPEDVKKFKALCAEHGWEVL